jgi:hypothetical protein
MKVVDILKLKEGDQLTLSYGIPPTLAKMRMEMHEGELQAHCSNASPEWCTLVELASYADDIELVEKK